MASAKIQRMSKSVKQNPAGQDRPTRPSDVPSEIQCKICKKRYEDPKLLPCLHTFCKACLEKSLEKHGILYCPSCPGDIRLSNDLTGVEKLPNNCLVSNLLQAIDLKNGVGAKQCESCDEKEQATSRCFECSDFLCENCVEAHRRVRFTKQHRVVPVKNLNADALFQTPNCSTHAQEPVKMFCKQCKELVCRSCIVHEHSDHALASLKDAAGDSKPKLNTLLVTTRARIPILQRKLKEVHASKARLEEKVDDVIKGIQATSARVLMAVKRREKDLYRMLRRIHDKKSDELEGMESDLQNELAQVLDGCEFTDELAKQENDMTVLSVSELTCARLKDLCGKEIAQVPEVHDDEIVYTAEEKPILDELKIYGKVMSREDKAKKSVEKARDRPREKRSRSANVGKDKEGKGDDASGKEENAKKQDVKTGGASKEDAGNATVERRQSWLESLVNPRAILRRLSFIGGDESDGKQAGEQSKDNAATTRTAKDDSKGRTETKSTEKKSTPTETSQEKSQDKDKGKGEIKVMAYSAEEKNKKAETSSKLPSEKNPSPSTHQPEGRQCTEDTNDDPATTLQTRGNPNGTSAVQPPPTSTADAVYETPKSNSILKLSPPPDDSRGHSSTESSPSSSQTWTVAGGSRPSGANSLSYLPTLNILTKNRRGRPREVEIQLESPDNSIISAQILDHKNGTYTIFYCPLSPGEHNLYVNVVGKNIKHGKKVLNFYGKFGAMGAEELFLTRRALSCIRWQVTPGFVELKENGRIKANPDI